jgi:hypothetical protein
MHTNFYVVTTKGTRFELCLWSLEVRTSPPWYVRRFKASMLQWEPRHQLQRKYGPMKEAYPHLQMTAFDVRHGRNSTPSPWLRHEDNLSITFDGNTTGGRDSIYMIHIITSDRRVYLFEGNSPSDKSHDAEHLFSIIDGVSALSQSAKSLLKVNRS